MEYEKIDVLDDKFIVTKPLIEMWRGSSDVSRNSILCAGNTPTDSQNSFNVPIVPGSWLDPYPMVHSRFQFDVNMTNATAGPLAAGTQIIVPGVDVTMSEYPFMCNVAGLTSVNFNTKTVCQLDLSQYAKMLMKLNDNRKNMDKATCPSAGEDGFALVCDAYLTSGNSAATFNDARDGFIPNGSWKFLAVINVDPANAVAPTNDGTLAVALAAGGTTKFTFVCETWEPLLIPPFVYDPSKSSSDAIFGLSNLTINIANNAASAFRALRVMGGAGATAIPPTPASALNAAYRITSINGFTMNISTLFNTGGPMLELIYKTYQTPYLKDFRIPSPFYTKHSWQFLTNFTTGSWSTPLAANASQLPIKSNTIHVANVVSTGMPRYIVLWCDKIDTSYRIFQNKYYYPITNIQIGLSQRQNILSNFDIRDLYNLSKDAGLNQSLISYLGSVYSGSLINAAAAATTSKQVVGGPVVLVPGVSFPLPADLATNSDGSYTFTFDAVCQSYNFEDVSSVAGAVNSTPRLNHMLIYDTWIKIDTSNLNVDVVRAPLTRADVTGISSEVVPSHDIEPEHGGVMHHRDSIREHGRHKYSAPRKINSRLKH